MQQTHREFAEQLPEIRRPRTVRGRTEAVLSSARVAPTPDPAVREQGAAVVTPHAYIRGTSRDRNVPNPAQGGQPSASWDPELTRRAKINPAIFLKRASLRAQMAMFSQFQQFWVSLLWMSCLAPTMIMCPGLAMAQTSALMAADQAWADGDFDAAINNYEDALRSGSLDRGEVAHVLRMVGIFRSIFDDMDAAQHAFERAFALEPAQPTPSELPPGRMTAFDGARAQNHGPMRLTAIAEANADGSILVTPSLVRAPTEWVEKIEVIVMATEGEPLWQGERPTLGPITVPARAVRGELQIQLIAYDSFGNTLASTTTSFGTPAVTPIDPAPGPRRAPTPWTPVEEPDDGGGILASPVFWVVVGAVILGGVITAIALTTDGEHTLGQPQFAMP